MAVYTVHEPPLRRHESAPAPERFAFVRDGFSLWACVFGPFWMLRHRMWLVLLGYVILVAGIEIGLHVLRVSPTIGLVVGVLLALLIGFEAGTLRRFTLGRRKWTNIGLVVGDDLETAEQRFFDGWARQTPAQDVELPRPPSSPMTPMGAPTMSRQTGAPPDVIGLFPQPGGQR